jgi:hypothetical protein
MTLARMVAWNSTGRVMAMDRMTTVMVEVVRGSNGRNLTNGTNVKRL